MRDLVEADEAFLSSSVAGILPVTRFAGEPVGDGRPGEWTLPRPRRPRGVHRGDHEAGGMTRDELIARTRQLVDEGDRLQQQPTLRGLQTWLQLSDDLLSAAWGSMDRYHLAWLMVGKPKDIVRGRPMTPDEEAAYVREVAEAKTSALRMSLDAVERQGMPFVGEERGMAPGQGMGARARRPASVTAPHETTLAVGGERQVPVPDPIARDYLLLCLRLDQQAPGLVDGYYGPADLKAPSTRSSSGRPARLADDAAALRDAARRRGRAARSARLAGRPAHGTRGPGSASWPATTCRTSS